MPVRIQRKRTKGWRIGRTEAEVRPIHKPEPRIYVDVGQRCRICGELWAWVYGAKGTKHRRHYPGTFWERD